MMQANMHDAYRGSIAMSEEVRCEVQVLDHQELTQSQLIKRHITTHVKIGSSELQTFNTCTGNIALDTIRDPNESVQVLVFNQQTGMYMYTRTFQLFDALGDERREWNGWVEMFLHGKEDLTKSVNDPIQKDKPQLHLQINLNQGLGNLRGALRFGVSSDSRQGSLVDARQNSTACIAPTTAPNLRALDCFTSGRSHDGSQPDVASRSYRPEDTHNDEEFKKILNKGAVLSNMMNERRLKPTAQAVLEEQKEREKQLISELEEEKQRAEEEKKHTEDYWAKKHDELRRSLATTQDSMKEENLKLIRKTQDHEAERQMLFDEREEFREKQSQAQAKLQLQEKQIQEARRQDEERLVKQVELENLLAKQQSNNERFAAQQREHTTEMADYKRQVEEATSNIDETRQSTLREKDQMLDQLSKQRNELWEVRSRLEIDTANLKMEKEREVARMQRELDETRRSMSAQNTELEERLRNEKMSVLQGEQVKTEEMQLQDQKYNQRIDDLMNQIRSSDEKYSEMEMSLKQELNTTKIQQMSENASNRNQITNLQWEQKEKDEQLSKLNADMEKMKEELETRKEGFSSEHAAFSENLDITLKRSTKLEEENKKLINELKQNETKRLDMEMSFNEKEEELRKQNEEIRTKARDLEEKHRRESEINMDLTLRVQSQQKETEEIKKKQDENERLHLKTADDIEQKCSELQQSLNEQIIQHKALKDENAYMRGKLEQTQTNLNEKTDLYMSILNQNKELRTTQGQLAHTLEETQRGTSAQSGELERLKDQIQEREKSLQDMEMTLRQQTESFDARDRERQELQSELEAQKQKEEVAKQIAEQHREEIEKMRAEAAASASTLEATSADRTSFVSQCENLKLKLELKDKERLEKEEKFKTESRLQEEQLAQLQEEAKTKNDQLYQAYAKIQLKDAQLKEKENQLQGENTQNNVIAKETFAMQNKLKETMAERDLFEEKYKEMVQRSQEMMSTEKQNDHVAQSRIQDLERALQHSEEERQKSESQVRSYEAMLANQTENQNLQQALLDQKTQELASSQKISQDKEKHCWELADGLEKSEEEKCLLVTRIEEMQGTLGKNKKVMETKIEALQETLGYVINALRNLPQRNDELGNASCNEVIRGILSNVGDWTKNGLTPVTSMQLDDESAPIAKAKDHDGTGRQDASMQRNGIPTQQPNPTHAGPGMRLGQMAPQQPMFQASNTAANLGARGPFSFGAPGSKFDPSNRVSQRN